MQDKTKIHIKITSPERVVFESDVLQISLPTDLGEITVLPHHLPLISSLVAGEIKVLVDSEELFFATSGGFVEVTDMEIHVLVDTAERSEEIDIARAQEAKLRAEKLLTEKRSDALEYAALMSKIEKELARLNVGRKRRRRL